eukprot:GHVU01078537.1.p1 GENE.GHVU01078537.1~~GHVU01078537.1.p1  ORF type:complete len:182 (-),score=41.48 GHVU01078537.1:91-636(-)
MMIEQEEEEEEEKEKEKREEREEWEEEENEERKERNEKEEHLQAHTVASPAPLPPPLKVVEGHGDSRLSNVFPPHRVIVGSKGTVDDGTPRRRCCIRSATTTPRQGRLRGVPVGIGVEYRRWTYKGTCLRHVNGAAKGGSADRKRPSEQQPLTVDDDTNHNDTDRCFKSDITRLNVSGPML